MPLLTKTRTTSVDGVPGLVGVVRQVTATDPAIAALFQVALAAGRAVEEAKAGLATREAAAKTRQGDMLNQLEDVRELRAARAKMDELEGTARAAHHAWSGPLSRPSVETTATSSAGRPH